ncbi:hypothetical protein ABIB35_003718 [Arthrobacter sp. UYP6]|uniref:hypothetical protein n=1 Tax=Arthrobacter sp. UYP6 TaxID=1756378 RepID=UPI00339078BD
MLAFFPAEYLLLYVGSHPEAAVAEALGRFPVWCQFALVEDRFGCRPAFHKNQIRDPGKGEPAEGLAGRSGQGKYRTADTDDPHGARSEQDGE